MIQVKNNNTHIGFILFILVFLAAQDFFNPYEIVSSQMGKFAFYAFSLIAFLYALRYGVNIKRVTYPKKAYRLVIAGIVFSIFMVQLFQEQSLIVTIIATLPYIFGYLFFFTLMKFDISMEDIEKALKWFTIASVIIYLANLWAFPNRIFGEEKDEMDMTRGFMRLGVPMILTVVTYFFYCINRWLVDGKVKWLWWIALTAVMIVMSLTRQVILVSFILGIFFIMKKAKMWKRISVILLGIVFCIVVLPEIPIYKTMLKLSEKQIEMTQRGKENIRITSWRFYTHNYQTNEWTYIFGNGVPSVGNSYWGNKYANTVMVEYGGKGYYSSDVSWASFFWYFGAIATIGLFLLLIKGVRRKKNYDKEYLTYAILFVMITAIASGPLILHRQIIEICIILYLIYSKQNSLYAPNSNNNSQLQ